MMDTEDDRRITIPKTYVFLLHRLPRTRSSWCLITYTAALRVCLMVTLLVELQKHELAVTLSAVPVATLGIAFPACPNGYVWLWAFRIEKIYLCCHGAFNPSNFRVVYKHNDTIHSSLNRSNYGPSARRSPLSCSTQFRHTRVCC